MILSLLLKYWRELLIAILVCVCGFAFNKCQSNASDKDVLSHKYDSTYLVATYYKNKHGEVIGQVKNHELTIRQLKDFGEQLGFDNKQLRDQVGNLNRLVGYWKGQASVRDSVIITLRDTVIVDGINTYTKAFEWNNDYLFLNGNIDLQNNQLALQYQYDVNFELVSYRKGKTFFKSGTLVSDIKFSDPNIRVREFSGFVIVEPKKKWYETRAAAFGVGVLTGFAIRGR